MPVSLNFKSIFTFKKKKEKPKQEVSTHSQQSPGLSQDVQGVGVQGIKDTFAFQAISREQTKIQSQHRFSVASTSTSSLRPATDYLFAGAKVPYSLKDSEVLSERDKVEILLEDALLDTKKLRKWLRVPHDWVPSNRLLSIIEEEEDRQPVWINVEPLSSGPEVNNLQIRRQEGHRKGDPVDVIYLRRNPGQSIESLVMRGIENATRLSIGHITPEQASRNFDSQTGELEIQYASVDQAEKMLCPSPVQKVGPGMASFIARGAPPSHASDEIQSVSTQSKSSPGQPAWLSSTAAKAQNGVERDLAIAQRSAKAMLAQPLSPVVDQSEDTQVRDRIGVLSPAAEERVEKEMKAFWEEVATEAKNKATAADSEVKAAEVRLKALKETLQSKWAFKLMPQEKALHQAIREADSRYEQAVLDARKASDEVRYREEFVRQKTYQPASIGGSLWEKAAIDAKNEADSEVKTAEAHLKALKKTQRSKWLFKIMPQEKALLQAIRAAESRYEQAVRDARKAAY